MDETGSTVLRTTDLTEELRALRQHGAAQTNTCLRLHEIVADIPLD
jgi:hypothetical protein